MRYDFGACYLDTASRQITRNGEAMHLSPKAFELLRFLIESRPRVVPKAELMQRLWPDAFVEEANLPVLIREVRTAIGDGGAARTIRTHHRVGYGFAADVRETPSAGGRQHAGCAVLTVSLNGRRMVLCAGVNIVGRDPAGHLHLDDRSVSRRHAQIVVDGDTTRVEDLGSKNGTLVQGRRVSGPVALANGDVVTFGRVETRFEKGPLDETATNPM